MSSGASVFVGGPPVVQVTVNHDKGFGFVEFAAMEAGPYTCSPVGST